MHMHAMASHIMKEMTGGLFGYPPRVMRMGCQLNSLLVSLPVSVGVGRTATPPRYACRPPQGKSQRMSKSGQAAYACMPLHAATSVACKQQV